MKTGILNISGSAWAGLFFSPQVFHFSVTNQHLYVTRQQVMCKKHLELQSSFAKIASCVPCGLSALSQLVKEAGGGLDR